MSEYEGEGRKGARSDGYGGISDGKGNKDTGSGGGGGGRDKAREGKTAGGGGGGTTEAGGPERSGDAGHSGNDSSQSEADQQSTPETDVDIADWANQTQQHVLAQMARQGLVVGTDDQGNITSAEPERAASFNLLGANDMGTGTLRARTPDEISSYGIDLGSLSPRDQIRTIDPGGSIASDIQRAATTGGGIFGGPVGAAAGLALGGVADAKITQSRLEAIGFDAKTANAIAEGNVADRSVGRAIGMATGPLTGPLSGALASSITSDIPGQMAIGMGLQYGANSGIQLASNRLGKSAGQSVYDSVMNGTAPSGNSPSGITRDNGSVNQANQGNTVLASAGKQGAPMAGSTPATDNIGQSFYDYVSKWGGNNYV